MKHNSNPSDDQTVVLLDDSLRATEGFTQIPNSVLRHPTLPIAAKLVYSVLLSYAWQDHFCHPAQESIAKDCSLSRRQVIRILKELKEVGAITWKQLGLNRPNRYYIHPITNWIKPKQVPNPLIEKEVTPMSHPEVTPVSHQEVTPTSGQEVTPVSHYKDSKKNTQRTTHTKRGVFSSLEKKKAQTLIERFHAEHGRPVEGRKPNRNELDFALGLIAEHGYEKANYVINFGLRASKETNYTARFFQGYDQYVAEALADFDQEQKREQARERAEERERAEQRKALEETVAYYAQPLEERVERALTSWVTTSQKLKKRKLTSEEIQQKRAWFIDYQTQEEARFKTEQQSAYL